MATKKNTAKRKKKSSQKPSPEKRTKKNSKKQTDVGTVSLLALHRLSTSEMIGILSDINDQKVNPEEARLLLFQFCDLYDLKKWEDIIWNKFPDLEYQLEQLTRHLRDSLKSYLSGEKKTLESAFGLVPRKGRPNTDLTEQTEKAYALLKLRVVDGLSHEKARNQVAGTEGKRCSFDVVNRAWRAAKGPALERLRLERCESNPDASPWTPEERKRLLKIFPMRRRSPNEAQNNQD